MKTTNYPINPLISTRKPYVAGAKKKKGTGKQETPSGSAGITPHTVVNGKQ